MEKPLTRLPTAKVTMLARSPLLLLGGGGAETFKQDSLPVFTDPKALSKEVIEKLNQSLKQLHTSHCAKTSEAVGI